MSNLPITILAGGVGGSKLVDGLARTLDDVSALNVIGNIGDDIEQHGLWVSPDMDILTYTLAGRVDAAKGWGLEGDTFRTLQAMSELGEHTWMNLGDLDLATHIFRTHQRKKGVRPTEIARQIAERMGVRASVLPPTDDPLTCLINTPDGWLSFQEFYLREKCIPEIRDVQVAGSGRLKGSMEAVAAVNSAAVLLIAPSNPVASIMPILAVNQIRTAFEISDVPRIAVCPLVGGKSLKGPTDRMLKAKGFECTPTGVASWYRGLISGLVIDKIDECYQSALLNMGLAVCVTDTVMKTTDDRLRLARAVLDFAGQLR